VVTGQLGYDGALMPSSVDQGVIRASADADHESVVDLVRRLVQIPSRAGIDPYEPIFELIERWLLEHGLRPQRLFDDNNSIGLVCDVQGAQAGPKYVLDACVDTAPFGDERAWRLSPTAGAMLDGWLFGRGSADCKAAVAIFSHIARRLHEGVARLAGQVTLLFDADEHTGRFAGVKRYFLQPQARKVAGVMIGYPGTEEVVIGARGFLRAELTVAGAAAHSGGRAKTTDNAVLKAASLVTALSHQTLPVEVDATFPLPPKLTVAAIKGGQGYTIVPDTCTIAVDVRLTPAFDAAAAARLLEEVVDAIDRQVPSARSTNIHFEESWPAYRLGSESRLGQVLPNVASKVAGRAIGTKIAGPSNIGNYLATLGVEATAGFGVGYRNLHGIDECIDVATIPLVQATYHLALLQLLGAPDPDTSPTSC